MEIFRGWTHAVFPVDEPSRIGEARRFAAHAGQSLGLGEVEAGRLALVVTELGTNLLRHARGGRLLIAVRPSQQDVEVIAIDDGPGIADLPKSMRDGFSTGSGSPGTGLGALSRLSTDFDIYSSVPTDTRPGGTLCVARVRRAGVAAPSPDSVQVGAVALCAPGETVCGDDWAVALDGADASLMMADGLGHGPEAAKASAAACEVFVGQPFGDMAATLADMHTALQTTRGAAVSCLLMSGDQLRCAGAGNVLVRLISGVFDKGMATQHGTVGLQMRKTHESTLAMPQHALAIMHSDGIESRWDPARIRPLLDRDPTLIAALLVRDHTRHRDDATVVVLRRPA